MAKGNATSGNTEQAQDVYLVAVAVDSDQELEGETASSPPPPRAPPEPLDVSAFIQQFMEKNQGRSE